MNRLSSLVRTGKTIFTTGELCGLWDMNRNTVNVTASRLVQQKSFIRLRRGIFALSSRFNPYELGCKLMTGSYISLFTALKEHGVIFQENPTIYLVGPRPRFTTAGGRSFQYHTIKSLLSIPDGIDFRETYSIASLERALLDMLCVFAPDTSDYVVTRLDRDKFLRLASFYPKVTQRRAQLL